MNFLAHIFLSGNNDELKIGNFIADAVKGNKYKNYPEGIQKGILLHRQIDSFTDAHPIVRRSKRRLHARYRHYDGVIIDILYDHFLAKNWLDYHREPLSNFAGNFYLLLEKNKALLPEKVKTLMPYMIAQNWLASYATLEGIEKVLQGMNRRTQEKSQMHLAIKDLQDHYLDFENDFTEFFKNLRNFCELTLKS